MDNFVYGEKFTKIIFGKGTENQVGKEIVKYGGHRVFLHYGGGSVKNSGLYDKVITLLKAENLEIFELGGAQPNPRIELAYEGIKICKENNVDFILAIGGGSTIDSAKAIGMGALYDGDVWDYYSQGNAPLGSGETVDPPMLKLGTILTLPATGTESSMSSVMNKLDPKLGMIKYPADYETLRPEFSILNPEFTFTLPDYQTAAGITDILTHNMERYFSQSKGVDFTSRACEGAMISIIENAKKILVDERRDDYDVRANIMWAGSVCHNNSLNLGRVGDWASHMIEHELSAFYDIAHGAGLAVIFPAWMKYVYKENVPFFANWANKVWGVPSDHEDPEWVACEGISRLINFYKQIGMPVTLSEMGIGTDKFRIMAERAVGRISSKSLGNFKTLYVDDVENVLQIAK